MRLRGSRVEGIRRCCPVRVVCVMDHSLRPHRPEDAHLLFTMLHEDLQAVLGPRPETQPLALIAARHLMGEEMIRLLLIGATGVGKTHMARAVARVVGAPFLEMNVSHMSEEGWKGAGPSEHLATLLAQASLDAPTETAAIAAAERGVLLIDELDKARLAPPSASASTRENLLGKQRGLLPIIGDGVVTIESHRQSQQWRSRHALVMCAGVFDGLPINGVSAESLTDWGMLPELAERLAFGSVIGIMPMNEHQLVSMLLLELVTIEQMFSRFGYAVEIPNATLNYVARHVASTSQNPGIRSASGLLRNVANDMLLRMLAEGSPIGSTRVLGPDDVRLPPRSRGIWRE